MQTQIHKDSWHWMVGFGHLAPVVHLVNKGDRFVKNDFTEEKIELPGYFKRGPKVPATDSQKALMIQEIRRLILAGVTTNIDIYYELEGLGLLPEKDGKLFSDQTLAAYITQVRRDLFPDNKKIQEHIISMFKEGISRKEIKLRLKTSSQYIRQCLIKAEVIEKQLSKRPKRDNQKVNKNVISQ